MFEAQTQGEPAMKKITKDILDAATGRGGTVDVTTTTIVTRFADKASASDFLDAVLMPYPFMTYVMPADNVFAFENPDSQKPIEAFGVKGRYSTSWRRSFPNRWSMARWVEANDAEVHGTREVE
jgi:hypothetical protein